MRPDTRVRNVTSTLQGEKVGMSIDEGALAHIMSVLTDLYSDPEMAVLREYSTNAYDAHVEAGVTLPVEVTLPTSLSPYLTIRDYGNGLDIDDIREIYSRYGASTKRETNDLVGSLGLGCKSALTYTDQFTLQGIKDGTATQVAISRDEDGTGSMTIVSTYETDEASGVMISIPVNARNFFGEKAKDFFRFWESGTVLVNGEEPEQISGLELAPDLVVVPRETLDENVIVMGHVPYPAPALRFDSQNFRVVAYVPIGAVQFTPSRESLQMTPKTTAVIEEIKERVKQGIEGASQRIVNEAISKPDALKAALHARYLFNFRGELQYQGDVVPDFFELDKTLSADGKRPMFHLWRLYRHRYSRGNQGQESRLPTSIVNKAIFIKDYPNTTVAPTNKQRLDQWWGKKSAELAGVSPEQFVLCLDLPLSEWVDPKLIHSWNEIKAEKIERKNLSGRPAGAYEVLVPGQTYHTSTLTADQIDPLQPIFYFEYHTRPAANVRAILEAKYPGCIYVELMENRVAKFRRLFPTAKRAAEAAREIAQAWFDKLSEDDRTWLILQENMRSRSDYLFERLDASRIEDPEFSNAVRQRNVKRPKLAAKAKSYSGLFSMPEFDLTDPLQRYPMLEPLGDIYVARDMVPVLADHAYVYINAMYHKSQEETN